MENLKKYAASFILGVVFCLIVFKSCEPDTSTVEVITPEIEKELPEVNPEEVDGDSIVYVDRWHTKDSIITVKLKNPVNDSLVQVYKEAADEIQRYKIYLRSIEIRKYSQVFEDEYIRLTISGNVQGDILSMAPDYTLKPRKTTAKLPETVFRWTLGGQFRTDLGLQNPTFDITTGLQNRKGDILRLGFSKINSVNYYLVGYEFSVLSLKK